MTEYEEVKPPISTEQVKQMFKLCKDLIVTGLRPGDDAEAVIAAVKFLDSLIASGPEEEEVDG